MKTRKIWSVVLVLALLLSVSGIKPTKASAAGQMKLNVGRKITLTKGKSKKVKVKNLPKKAKVTWTSKNKKIAKVAKKTGKITAVKKGKTKVSAKVVYKNKGKKKTKKFTVTVVVRNPEKVTATKAPGSATSPTPGGGATAAPTQNPTPGPTAEPTPTPKPTAQPNETNLGEEHLSANGLPTRDNGLMRDDLTASDLMQYMGQGINIGNTMEAILAESDIHENTTVSDFERAWGNPLIVQELLDGYKEQGFNTVRVPIAWSNMIVDKSTYEIDESLLNRVEEVINYALNDEMYVIINIHWDSGWWGQFGDRDETVRAEAWKRYEAFWTQIANRYQEYSDRLIFESANEELGDRLNDDWVNQSSNPKTGTLTEKEQYETVLAINQKFVDIVRGSGGNNEKRQLLIAGFNTDIVKTTDNRYRMPTDIEGNGKDKLSISVHYYTPATYCILDKDESWGKNQTSWGTDADIAELHRYFDMMQKFTNEGYGVIIGEYGVPGVNKDGIPAFLGEVARYGKSLGYTPVLWDIGTLFSRVNYKMKYADIAELYKEITGSDVEIDQNAERTGIKSFETVPDSNLELKYTWTGTWNKNDGSNYEGICFETKSCDEGLTVVCNSWFYYVYLEADWENMKKPCVKAYLTDMKSSQALELAYIDYVDGIPDNPGDQSYGSVKIESGWQGNAVTLDRDMLLKYDALFLTFGGKATCTKIEIYDVK